jgi:GTP pyrophosphokinase
VHVSAILQRYGFPHEAIIAALLHDVVEDQDVTVAEIEARFGASVAEIVDALSEDRSDGRGGVRPWHVRKAEAVEKIRQASVAAAAVKAADVLHNAQSILYDLRHDGAGVWQRFTRGPEQMVEYYGRIAELVQAKLGSHPLVGEVLAVLDAFKVAATRSGDDSAQSRGER